MNIYIGTEHLKTLEDLRKIAEKHDCAIRFGYNDDVSREIEGSFLDRVGINRKTIDALCSPHCFSVKNALYTCRKYWFELYENKTDKSNTMTYIDEDIYFEVDDIFRFDEMYQDECDTINEFIEEHAEIYGDCGNSFAFSDNPTLIYGFGNKKRISDYRCYREGMALKYFSDLVCDYLGEKRIERVY